MKIIHLVFIALLAGAFSLSVVSVDSYAATAKKEPSVSANTGKMMKAAPKVIPHDVNINTADKKLLTELPGIGPVTAEAIIDYRTTNGQFKSLNELTKVKGIGVKTLAKLKPYLQKI